MADEMLERIEKLLTRSGEGALSMRYDENHKEWSVMGVFGKEAEDSPMAGGAVHGLSDTLEGALNQALAEARL